ncbi:hypothetical protein ACFE04_008872 [Oxalis oulophora]
MAIVAMASSLTLGPLYCQSCHAQGCYCSASYSYGNSNNFIKSSFDSRGTIDLSGTSLRCRYPLFGSSKNFKRIYMEHELFPSKVSVAADYPDSVPDSFHYANNKRGYHPLEEVEVSRKVQESKLTPAEIARTTLEAHNRALLVFPSTVHCEPHGRTSWAEYQYIIDEYGDIFFEICDGENLLRDQGESDPVHALIGIDLSSYESKTMDNEFNTTDAGIIDDILSDDEFFEVMDSEMSEFPVDWGMPDFIHPIYFAKCLKKAVNTECKKNMEHPSNGVSIMGFLRPVFVEEETHLRRLFNGEESDEGYSSDWKDTETLNLSSKDDESIPRSTIYKLEILKIEMFSAYGVEFAIGVQDFLEAEPDFLVHSSSAIIERFVEKGFRYNDALKALCKKKGLLVERAHLIGVDSLGIDVRVFYGAKVQTHRFPFRVQATSAIEAEKQIQRLLFPRSRRKRFSTEENKQKKNQNKF